MAKGLWAFITNQKDEQDYTPIDMDTEDMLLSMVYDSPSRDGFLDRASRFEASHQLTEQQLIGFWNAHKNDADDLADALGANEWGAPPAGFPVIRVLLTLAFCAIGLLCIYAMYVFTLADFFAHLQQIAPENMPLFCIHQTCYWLK